MIVRLGLSGFPELLPRQKITPRRVPGNGLEGWRQSVPVRRHCREQSVQEVLQLEGAPHAQDPDDRKPGPVGEALYQRLGRSSGRHRPGGCVLFLFLFFIYFLFVYFFVDF